MSWDLTSTYFKILTVIFNCDESSFYLHPKRPTIIVQRGQRNVYDMSSTSNKENLTILIVGNAAGELAPLMALYSFKRIPTLMAAASPPEWGIRRSKNGWITCRSFYEYIGNVFVPYLKEKKITKPIILLLDGHKSHISLPLSKLCKKSSIELVAFPPNATYIIQPLDVSFFAPLKENWRKELDHFKLRNNGHEVQRHQTSPHNYATAEEYARDIKEKMGISIDVNEVASNPGKRAVAKLCLNSLWGKFGQRQNMSTTEFVTNPCRFYEILLDDRLKDLHVFYLNDYMIQVNLIKFKEYYVDNLFNTNIFVAVYITANARLRLYDALWKLHKTVIYCDTDSVIYVDNGGNTIETRDILSEWTDELAGGYIEKFISIGPKSYYYKTNKNKETTKVKGFTLNHKNAAKINGETLEKLIDREIENIVTEGKQIIRDIHTKNLVNKDQIKKLGFKFDKRIINKDFDTLPFGYKDFSSNM